MYFRIYKYGGVHVCKNSERKQSKEITLKGWKKKPKGEKAVIIFLLKITIYKYKILVIEY